jgi:hypothetical protein
MRQPRHKPYPSTTLCILRLFVYGVKPYLFFPTTTGKDPKGNPGNLPRTIRQVPLATLAVEGKCKVQEFKRHRVKFSTAAKLTHAR